MCFEQTLKTQIRLDQTDPGLLFLPTVLHLKDDNFCICKVLKKIFCKLYQTKNSVSTGKPMSELSFFFELHLALIFLIVQYFDNYIRNSIWFLYGILIVMK